MTVSVTNGAVETYLWYEAGNPDVRLYESANYGNVTTNQLTFKDVTEGLAGSYYCRIKQSGTSCYFNSNTASLTVTPLAVSNPADKDVCEGATDITISVSVPCVSAVEWYVVNTSGSTHQVVIDDMFYKADNSAGNYKLIIPQAVNAIHAGQYYCVVRNGSYSATSNACILTINSCL